MVLYAEERRITYLLRLIVSTFVYSILGEIPMIYVYCMRIFVIFYIRIHMIVAQRARWHFDGTAMIIEYSYCVVVVSPESVEPGATVAGMNVSCHLIGPPVLEVDARWSTYNLFF